MIAQQLEYGKFPIRYVFLISLISLSFAAPIYATEKLNGVYVYSSNYNDFGFNAGKAHRVLLIKDGTLIDYDFECTDRGCEKYFSAVKRKVVKRYRNDRHIYDVERDGEIDAYYIGPVEGSDLGLRKIKPKYLEGDLKSGKAPRPSSTWHKVPKNKESAFLNKLKKWNKKLGTKN